MGTLRILAHASYPVCLLGRCMCLCPQDTCSASFIIWRGLQGLRPCAPIHVFNTTLFARYPSSGIALDCTGMHSGRLRRVLQDCFLVHQCLGSMSSWGFSSRLLNAGRVQLDPFVVRTTCFSCPVVGDIDRSRVLW